MSDVEIIKETPTHRLIVVRDEWPDMPYDDGGFPVIYRPYSRGRPTQVTDITSHVIDARILDALAHFGSNADAWERYARIFHGARTFAYRRDVDRNGEYIALDTAEWREEMQLTDDHLAAHPDIDWSARFGDLSDYWDGDVYYASAQERVSDCDNLAHSHWETVDSLHGLYGHDYAITDGAAQVWLEEYGAPLDN